TGSSSPTTFSTASTRSSPPASPSTPRTARCGNRRTSSRRRAAASAGVTAALVDGELLLGDVEGVDGRIAAVGLAGSSGRGIAAPGFVDLQVNGYAGVDFSAAGEDDWRVAREALLRDGVTAFQPTFVTAPLEAMRAALARMPPPDRPAAIAPSAGDDSAEARI